MLLFPAGIGNIDGLNVKDSCLAATTNNILLSGIVVVDGITPSLGDRVLVKNQTNAADNGIYIVASGAWQRSTDMNEWAEVPSAFTFIETGLTQADTAWYCTSDQGGTLGVTPINWTQYAGPGTYSAGNGLTLTGTVFSLDTPVSVANGGTGASTAPNARTNLGAAASGTNSDITSMTGVTGGISSPDFIQMDVAPAAQTLVAGKLWWDATGTLNIGMGNGAITQQVGEEIYIYGKASSNITEGQLIKKTGTVGSSGVITFGPTTANMTEQNDIIGVATENISANNFGRITFFGIVHGINTTGSSVGEVWADDDILYYNPTGSGYLTKFRPAAPNIKVQVATVINAGPGGSGSLQVYIQKGSILGETDSNVQFTTLTSGDTLIYDATAGYWKNSGLTAGSGITITPGPGSITISGSGVSSFSGGTTGLTPATATTGAVTLGGTLDVAHGGTGANTLTGYVKGTGTGALTASNTIPNTSITGLGTMSTQNANNVNITGGIAAGLTSVTVTQNPTTALQLATKQYVDNSVTTGIQIHTPVRVESPTALTAIYQQGGTTPTISDIINGDTLVSASHGLSVNDQIVFDSSMNGLLAATPYYVASTPTINEFTVSPTYGGAPETGLTNGSSLGLTSRANSGVGATLTNSTTYAALVIDGVTLSVGDRVLVYTQATAYQNGVYTVTDTGSGSTNWQLTRATDMNKVIPNSTSGLGTGDYFFVSEGSTGRGESYVMTTLNPIIIGATSLTFTQFSASTSYNAGTGLTLTGSTFSITPVGTAATYGSASSVPVFTTNASGQVSSVTNTSIAIANTQVSGLGTMSTQNANNVAITGGSIDGATVGSTTRAAGAFTTELVGPSASANFTRFPNALAATSNTSAGIQQNTSDYIGQIAEGVSVGNANASGVFGAGYTNASGTGKGTGVTGIGHVAASTDTGNAVGVSAYATDTHSGNYNIALYADASGSTFSTRGGNIALWVDSGNIVTGASKSWYLGGNITFDGESSVRTIGVTNGAVFALGTPSGGVLTNCTGLPVGGISATGTPSSTTYLRGDGTWATVSSGSGTVTSITAGTGLTGGTITTSGTIALADTAVTPGSYTNANITVDAQGRITLASSGSAGGVSSITGTANQITASASTGAVTLSVPSTFIAPGSIAATTTVTGTEVIASNGLIVNSQTIAASYNIPSGSNAMSTGPITVASGATVTVPSGSKWMVL